MRVDVHTHNKSNGIYVFNTESITTGHKYSSLSYHPWYVNQKSISKYLELIETKQYLILGEIGLDKIYRSSFDQQITDLKKIIDKCNQVRPKSLIFHCVRAFNEIIDILESLTYEPNIIFHDYSGSMETFRVIEKKFKRAYFSFGSSLFNETRKSTKAFVQISLNKIFLETDDQSQYTIDQIYDKAVHLKKVTISEIEQAVYNNFQNLL